MTYNYPRPLNDEFVYNHNSLPSGGLKKQKNCQWTVSYGGLICRRNGYIYRDKWFGIPHKMEVYLNLTPVRFDNVPFPSFPVIKKKLHDCSQHILKQGIFRESPFSAVKAYQISCWYILGFFLQCCTGRICIKVKLLGLLQWLSWIYLAFMSRIRTNTDRNETKLMTPNVMP